MKASHMKASHTGECQICGHIQKLPRNVLAKHGYTKRWGFFSGTCVGSGELPYELSCEVLPPYIESARLQRDAAKNDIQKVLALKNQCVVEFRIKSNCWGKRDTVEQRIVSVEQDGHYFYAVLPDGLRHKLDVYADTIPEVIAHFNKREAVRIQRGVVDNLESYIRWATDRVKSWEPKPLQAVVADEPEPEVPAGHQIKTVRARGFRTRSFEDWIVFNPETKKVIGRSNSRKLAIKQARKNLGL